MLKDLYLWYIENQKELSKKYEGKYLVIKDNSVVDVFSDKQKALDEASNKYGLGNFIIQLCSTEEDSYTQTYHSRVIFA